LGGLSNSKNEAEEDDNREDDQQPRKPRRKRGINTLEVESTNLNMKEMDLNFNVDPLFHKMRAVFDEGGAHGLLLNQLTTDFYGNLVFDSNAQPECLVDTSSSCDSTVSTGGEALEKLTSQLVLDFAPLCPSLEELLGSFAESVGGSKKKIDYVAECNQRPLGKDDEQIGDDDDDFGEDMAFEVDGAMQDEIDNLMRVEHLKGDAIDVISHGIDEKHLNVDFGETEQDLTLPNANENRSFATISEGQEQYLGLDAIKNWSGRFITRGKHWKFRERKAKVEESKDGIMTKGKNPRRGKKAKWIDFHCDISANIDNKKLQTSTRSKFTLSKATLKKASSIPKTLPEDMQYDEAKLRRLFTKSSLILTTVGPVVRLKLENGSSVEDDSDLNLALDNDFIGDEVSDNDIDHVPDEDVLEQPIAEVIPEVSSGTSKIEMKSMDSPAKNIKLVEQPKKVEKVKVKYARFVKTVNVLALKKTMWKAIEHKKSKGNPEKQDIYKEDVEDVGAKNTFSNVLSSLDGKLKGPQLSNTTVPFCFICLLHLCNENSLELEKVSSHFGVEGSESSNSFGMASDIKIVQ